MIITAKFESTCPTCRQPIRVGSEVEWERGRPAQHVACASGAPSAAAAAARGTGRRRAPRKPAAPRQSRRELQASEQMIGRRSKAYTIGETIHGAKLRGGGGPDGCYWTVTHEWFQRANEDLGYYDDEYMAHVRPATDEEVAPVLARRATDGARAACVAWLEAALSTGAPGVTTVSDIGTLPPAAERQVELVLGRRVGASGAVTDYGTTYVVTADSIVAHHGGHYDDDRSSTRTLALASTTIEESAAKREIAMLVTALAASDDQTITVLADRALELGFGAGVPAASARYVVISMVSRSVIFVCSASSKADALAVAAAALDRPRPPAAWEACKISDLPDDLMAEATAWSPEAAQP